MLFNNNAVGDIKDFFKKHQIIAWHIIYGYVLCLFWRNLLVLLQKTTLLTTLSIIITPSLFIIMYRLYSAAVEDEDKSMNDANSFTFKKLPPHHIEQLKNIVPIYQLDMLQDVMLVSLNSLYSSLMNIKDSNGVSLYEKKYDLILKMFDQLDDDDGKVQVGSAKEAKNIAIIVFSYYRILYKNTLEELQASQKTVNSYGDDPNVLLKRISPKLIRYLGAQSWRLFEFRQAIYGDLDSLSINSDIADDIKSYCDEQNVPSPMAFCGPVKPTNQAQTTQVAPPVSSVPAVTTSTVTTSNVPITNKSDAANQFIDWIMAKINSQDPEFLINETTYVFMQPLKHGDDVIFVSNELFDKYQSVKHIERQEMQTALLDTGLGDSNKYAVFHKGTMLNLMRINGIEVKVLPTAVIKIKEVK